MSEFNVYSDCENEWIEKDGNILFAADCAATMNQQAETIKQLKARVGRLEKCIIDSNACMTLHAPMQAKNNGKILNEAPQQSLAAIQAEAIEKAVREVRQQIPADNEFGSVDACYTYKLINYAADVRQQADKG